MSRLIPVMYRNMNYPPHIKAEICEIAGNFDREEIFANTPYSLHTEYSYGPRSFNSKIINDLEHIKKAQKGGIPQLWYNKEWSNNFFDFIDRLIGLNKPPKILEIHPPFSDYCKSFDQFLGIFRVFYAKFKKEYPETLIFIENRCGTLIGGKFLLSTGSDVLEFCSLLNNPSNVDIDLKIVLDYPQIFSAEKISLDKVDLNELEKVILFNQKLQKFNKRIGGFHLWGKRKSEKGRWVPHTGNFDTFFSNNNEIKHEFLNSVFSTFNDSTDRYFVPEVNSGEKDLHSIVADMEKEGFVFTCVAR